MPRSTSEYQVSRSGPAAGIPGRERCLLRAEAVELQEPAVELLAGRPVVPDLRRIGGVWTYDPLSGAHDRRRASIFSRYGSKASCRRFLWV